MGVLAFFPLLIWDCFFCADHLSGGMFLIQTIFVGAKSTGTKKRTPAIKKD
jgi:hypothetical protein